jgi:hypothetical protein
MNFIQKQKMSLTFPLIIIDDYFEQKIALTMGSTIDKGKRQSNPSRQHCPAMTGR